MHPFNQFPKLKTIISIPLAILFQLTALNSYSQYYDVPPEPEIAVGMKAVIGQIKYGPKPFYVTTTGGASIQPTVRWEAPLKIGSRTPLQHRYMAFVIDGGFLFCKAKVFDSVHIDNLTNTITRDHSYNTTYLPLYVGLCSKSTFSIGAELFYWKGLNAKSRDIWGTRFLSLVYNATRFRLGASGEWYAQLKNNKHSGILFSVDLLYKLFVED